MKDLIKIIFGILIAVGLIIVLITLAVRGLINWASGGSIAACLIAVVVTLIITEKYK